jgi:hypothetical protein
MAQEPLYPVGVQSFENIRRSSAVYVDKTDLIYKLTHEYEMVERLREQYDGYHFTDSMVDVFNPYSLLNAFSDCKLRNYWFQTGTPAFAINMLKAHKGEWTLDIDEIDALPTANLSEFSTPLEQATKPIPFLYQAGYLTIKAYPGTGDKYILGVPNTEVRISLLKNLIPLYTAMDPDKVYNVATDISYTRTISEWAVVEAKGITE